MTLLPFYLAQVLPCRIRSLPSLFDFIMNYYSIVTGRKTRIIFCPSLFDTSMSQTLEWLKKALLTFSEDMSSWTVTY